LQTLAEQRVIVGVQDLHRKPLDARGFLPFKGRIEVGMGSMSTIQCPIPLPASPLKGEERLAQATVSLMSNAQSDRPAA
jgi:hypothetical protein